MRGDNHLDELIDRALARYREAEPLLGMERRVLERAQAESRSRAFQWGAAACAIAAGLLIATVFFPQPQSLTSRVQIVETVNPAVTLPPAYRAEQVTFVMAEPRRPHRAALPKQLGFPVNKPMTAEESALVRLASYTSLSFSEPPSTVAAIEVQSLDVEPIIVDDAKSNFEEQN